MKINEYEVTETSDGLSMQRAKFSLRFSPSLILLPILFIVSVYEGTLKFESLTLESVTVWTSFILVLLGIHYIPSRPWHQKKSVRVSQNERAIFLDDQKLPFEEIQAITTERAFWRHDVVIYTHEKTIYVFPWVSQYEGTRLCEIICMRLPEKESLRLMPWGVSLWADSQRRTPSG